ncbi:MAG: GTPase Era [Bacteroidota bacterium]|nr:GTPase Era [Bacteroidota bacterium]
MVLKEHKSGFVSIIGNPNVGKSTLVNAIMGRDFSITTSKKQTTRHRILGLLNGENYQLVFSDTPGILKPKYEMQKTMATSVKESIVDADVLIYMTEVGERKIVDDKILRKVQNTKSSLLVLINKIDISNQKELEKDVKYWSEMFPSAEIIPISASTGFFVKELVEKLIKQVPESQAYFPKDQISDRPERFFVNEAIRKSILENCHNEVPYAVEVTTDHFRHSKKNIIINSTIIVERETQKGIIIGAKGLKLKKIGSQSRKYLEKFFEKKIFIELFVKVEKKWRSKPNQLKKFGYKN